MRYEVTKTTKPLYLLRKEMMEKQRIASRKANRPEVVTMVLFGVLSIVTGCFGVFWANSAIKATPALMAPFEQLTKGNGSQAVAANVPSVELITITGQQDREAKDTATMLRRMGYKVVCKSTTHAETVYCIRGAGAITCDSPTELMTQLKILSVKAQAGK